MKIYCCKCEKEVEAYLVKGLNVYPHRLDLCNLNFYMCPDCGNFVGCHKGTLRPLGCIPTKELKLARMKLHAKMDPLWKDKKLITRKQLYKRISDKLGYTYHNGETRTLIECFKVYDIVEEIEQELLNQLQPV